VPSLLTSLLLSLPLLGNPARAGQVTVPPPGASEVALLLCAGDGCPDRLFWVTNDPAFGAEPVMVVESLLADVQAGASDEVLSARFAESLERARLAAVESRTPQAQAALDDAEQALQAWHGGPDNAALFAFWYLRGVVMEQIVPGSGAGAFRRAAATAWNRSVAPPAGLEAWTVPYYAAMRALLDEGTGTLVIDPGGGTPSYTLDGVPVGKAPIKVEVFPDRHRLTAVDGPWVEPWVAEVNVHPGRLTVTRAQFNDEDSESWLVQSLYLAVTTHQLDPAVADLLERWADRHQIQSLHLLRLDVADAPPQDEISLAAGEGLPTFTRTEAWYQPRLHRFTAGP